MLRTIFYSIIILAISGFNNPEDKVKWVTLDQAQELAQDSSKAIIIDFTASWCGWCKVMDKNTFSDSEVASYMNENFYAVRLDYDSTEKLDFFGEELTARELGSKFRVPGLPTILLLSSDSKKSKKLVGYKQTESFLYGLKQFVN